jgi:SRSO17 transposase
LLDKGIELITNVKKGMKQVFLETGKKYLLRKRFVIETVFDQLKNKLAIEHTRHRSVHDFFLNIVSALVAYQFLPINPSVRFKELNNLQKDYTFM